MRDRRFTPAEAAALAEAAAVADQLYSEVRTAWQLVEVQARKHTAAVGGPDWYDPSWQFCPDVYGLAPLAEAIHPDAASLAPCHANGPLPVAGDLWQSRYNPATWQARNRRTRRELNALYAAMAACTLRPLGPVAQVLLGQAQAAQAGSSDA